MGVPSRRALGECPRGAVEPSGLDICPPNAHPASTVISPSVHGCDRDLCPTGGSELTTGRETSGRAFARHVASPGRRWR